MTTPTDELHHYMVLAKTELGDAYILVVARNRIDALRLIAEGKHPIPESSHLTIGIVPPDKLPEVHAWLSEIEGGYSPDSSPLH